MSNTTPITVSRHSSLEERQFALTQIYQQVLERQPYAFERKTLAKAERDFLNDKIGVRRFLRELGRSEVYLNAFYHPLSNLKFLELCFKHLLGRAPASQEEIALYTNVLMHEGVEKFISTLLDSEEYRKTFGCFTVPYPRQLSHYESPKAYWESKTLNYEHFGQRGHSIPTIYWHQLRLNCDAGVCHPEAKEVLNPPVSARAEILQEELQEILRSLGPSPTAKAIAALSPQQKALLRRAMR
jgi:phycoerythrin-associated linker protein